MDIVRAREMGFRLQRQIRRQCAAIRCARLLFVRERRDEPVRWPCRALEHVAGIVGTVGHLETRGDRLDLVLVVAEIGEVAVGDEFEAVAARTDLKIDLQAALQRQAVVLAERTVERPVLRRRLGGVAGGAGGQRRKCKGAAEKRRGDKPQRACMPGHHAFSIVLAEAPAVLPPPSTGEAMLAGSGFGRSNRPSRGMITMKCRKYHAVAICPTVTQVIQCMP